MAQTRNKQMGRHTVYPVVWFTLASKFLPLTPSCAVGRNWSWALPQVTVRPLGRFFLCSFSSGASMCVLGRTMCKYVFDGGEKGSNPATKTKSRQKKTFLDQSSSVCCVGDGSGLYHNTGDSNVVSFWLNLQSDSHSSEQWQTATGHCDQKVHLSFLEEKQNQRGKTKQRRLNHPETNTWIENSQVLCCLPHV